MKEQKNKTVKELITILAEMHAELDSIQDAKVIPVFYIKNRLRQIDEALETGNYRDTRKFGLGQTIVVDEIQMRCVGIKTDFSGDHYLFSYFHQGDLKCLEFDPGELDAMGAKADPGSHPPIARHTVP